MENPEKDLLGEKPRDPKEGILTKDFMLSILLQGALIAVCTMIAFHMGLSAGGSTVASTMAFATLTLARLFHGFNCRSKHSIFYLKLSTNWYSVGAFFAGVALLVLVLFVPILERLFSVSPLTGGQMGTIVVLAFIPTVLIQLIKVILEKRK